jgi:hypothetical protein
MATEKQRAANKANAQHSTGPTSEAGLLAAALNNFRHGMGADTHENFGFLCEESSEKFAELLKKLRDEYNPTSETESILVRHMAESEWLRGRALRFQADCMDTSYRNGDTTKLAVFIRYQNTHERAFYKALNELQSLRKQKQNSEIGFESHGLKKAADNRASEALNLKKEEFLLRKEVVQMKKEAQERRNPSSTTPAVTDVGLEMAA